VCSQRNVRTFGLVQRANGLVNVRLFPPQT
jgi:hypothetical protein